MTTSVEEMIEKYVVSWNNNSFEEFKIAFAECWAENATYTDPEFELINGIEGITDLAVISLERIPGRKFSVFTKPEHHHNVGRYNWSVKLSGGDKQGFDYFEFNKEYKITRIVSFF